MATLDIFKINFKKPTLTAEDSKKEEQKSKLNSLFESAYSRMESIEILDSNGKWEDSSIIMRLLALDLVNLSLIHFGKPNTQMGKDWKSEIVQLKNEKLTNLYSKRENILALSSDEVAKDESKMEELENDFSYLLSDLEKHYKLLKKSELKTPLSEQIHRWRIQGTVVAAVILFALGTIVYRRVKYPDLAKTDVKIYYMTKLEPGPKDEFSSAIKIQVEKKGLWNEYEFVLPKSADITEMRVDPVEQSRIRVELESMNFYNAKGKLLYTHDFLYGQDLLPKDALKYGVISELKMSGKAAPGAKIGMESLGADPFFHLRLDEIKGVSKITLKMRHLEAYKKFN